MKIASQETQKMEATNRFLRRSKSSDKFTANLHFGLGVILIASLVTADDKGILAGFHALGKICNYRSEF